MLNMSSKSVYKNEYLKQLTSPEKKKVWAVQSSIGQKYKRERNPSSCSKSLKIRELFISPMTTYAATAGSIKEMESSSHQFYSYQE